MAKVKIEFTPVPSDYGLYLEAVKYSMTPSGTSLVYTNESFEIKNNYLDISFEAIGIGPCKLTVTVDGKLQVYSGTFTGNKKAVVVDSLRVPLKDKADEKPIPYPKVNVDQP